MSLTADDRLEIQQLLSDYSYYEDTGAAEQWAALFTRDGRFVGGGKAAVVGTAALIDFAARRWNDKPEVRTRTHWISNVVIHPAPDGAEVNSYQMTVDKVNGELKVGQVSGKKDQVRKEDGRWKFFERCVVKVGVE